jgi:hypothetical protein
VHRLVAAFGFGADGVELVAGAVDEHHPAALPGGVTAGRFGEHLGDDLGGGGGDAGGQPLALSYRASVRRWRRLGGAGRAAGHGDDVSGLTLGWDGVIDRTDGGHPFTPELFPTGEPGGQFGSPGGGLERRVAFGALPQRLRSHHDALRVRREHQQIGIRPRPGLTRSREVIHINSAALG